jgi:O-antigen/teichoic acid export membrane protein
MPSLNKRRVLKGSASNLLRAFLSMLVSLVLPPFLVHRMSSAEYGAWVLILQFGAYVNFLDLGLSTAISKFVAEHDATGNYEAGRRLVSTAFTALCAVSALAMVALGVIIWYLPQLFHQMPPELIPEARLAMLAVGISTTLALPLSVFASIFNGLQRYGFPTALYTSTRVGSAVALVIIVLLHGSLVEMAVTIAAFNVLTGLLQVYGWWHLLRDRVGFTPFQFERNAGRQLAEYCGVLSIWTLGNIFISGLDTAIVARYDFAHTAFYAVAGSATNFMLMLVGNLMSPLLPALSTAQLRRTPKEMGDLIIKTTRYSALLLCVLGAPLVVGAYPLLTAWVGRDYAAKGALFLRLLIIGNVIRQLPGPYALTLIAMGKQRLATASPLAEAIINLIASVLLARRMGAVGVALGTVIGAVVGFVLHIVLSMSLSKRVAEIRRSEFLTEGLLRPMLCLAPLILLVPRWRGDVLLPYPPVWLVLGTLACAGIAWIVAVNADERATARALLHHLR